jgi:hypothetical protein
MGLRQKIERLLSRGSVAEASGDERVELTVMRYTQASVCTAHLQRLGLDAQCVEAFNVATSSLTDGRITVPRSQRARAEEALGDM